MNRNNEVIKYIRDFIDALFWLIEAKNKKSQNKVQESKTNNESKEVDFSVITEALLKYFFRNPGGLIFIDDLEESEFEKFKLALELFYKLNSDPQDLLDWIIIDEEGRFNELLYESAENYAFKALKLKPIFIKYNPEYEELYAYYNEAMRCWLHNLNNSSIVIISSLLENLLKKTIIRNPKISDEEFKHINLGRTDNIFYASFNVSFTKLIDLANKFRIFSFEQIRLLHEIRKCRNKIVHDKAIIDSNYAFDLLNRTRSMLEKLFNEN